MNGMFEKALIDGDIVTYRCAAANEQSDENIACWQAGEMIRRILHETNSFEPRVFLTGSNNFRFDLYPEYKANRKDMQRPRHYAAVREYLCIEWGASVTDGYEADDAMGMEQEENTIICSIDKDMLMIPGWHYNFVKQIQKYVTPLEGLRHLYKQAILGDKADNIPGYDGKMRDKVPKFMQWMFDELETIETEEHMYDFVSTLVTHDKLDTYLKCLWLWRKEGDIWDVSRVDRRKEEGLHHLDYSSGQQALAPEVRDIEGSFHREKKE